MKIRACALAALSVFLLTGWTGCTSLRLFTKPDPIDVHVSPLCSAPCEHCTETNPIAVTANPDSAIDALKVEHSLRQLCEQHVKACEDRKLTCTEALERGRAAEAIK